MKNFISVNDVLNVDELVKSGLSIKKSPYSNRLGENKTLGLLFFNPSLRTRMSTQKAAFNLGMNVVTLNVDKDSWKLEFEDGAIMNEGSQEHVKDAIGTLSQYCDIIGVRTFSGLINKEDDYSEKIINKVIKHATVPVLSLESATLHPLQSLADLMTIKETEIKRPKITVSWAPHPRPLPQAVANSFLEWVQKIDSDLTLTYPKGFELHPDFTQGIKSTNDQNKALDGADVVYVKNWSSYTDYGKAHSDLDNWMITNEKMALTNQAKMMHCLPIRRNVVATDEVIDQSLVLEQANNRTFAAQAVLTEILNNL